MSIKQIAWRPFIREEMPKAEMEIVTLFYFSIFKPPRKRLKSNVWTKNTDGTWIFLHSQEENTRFYAALDEFVFLPWRPFIREEMPKEEMELLFFNRLSPTMIHKLISDTWKQFWTEWSTECLQEFSYSHYCPLNEISLPEG